MRIHELLTEAPKLSLTKYNRTIHSAVEKAIVTSLVSLQKLRDEHDFRRIRNEVDRNGTISYIEGKIHNIFRNSLKWNIEKEISGSIRLMLSNDPQISPIKDSWDRSYTPVTFVDTINRGQAFGGSIELAQNYLDRLYKRVLNEYYDIVLGQFSGDSLYDEYFGLLKDSRVNQLVLHDVADIIDEISDTVIHELVHVLQFLLSLSRGYPFKYHSILSDPSKTKKGNSEFIRLSAARHRRKGLSSNLTQRWYKLYTASPQEMEAISHDIAMNIIRDWNYQDPSLDADTIADMNAEDLKIDIDAYLKSHLGNTPSNLREQRIYRWYLAMISRELVNYVKHRQSSGN